MDVLLLRGGEHIDFGILLQLWVPHRRPDVRGKVRSAGYAAQLSPSHAPVPLSSLPLLACLRSGVSACLCCCCRKWSAVRVCLWLVGVLLLLVLSLVLVRHSCALLVALDLLSILETSLSCLVRYQRLPGRWPAVCSWRGLIIIFACFMGGPPIPLALIGRLTL